MELIYGCAVTTSVGNCVGVSVGTTGGGEVLVGGATLSTDFPTLNEFQLDPGDAASDGFVASIDTAVAGPGSLLYSTYLGGNDEDEVFSIATDTAGRAYVTGVALSDDFPTLNEIQTDPGDANELRETAPVAPVRGRQRTELGRRAAEPQCAAGRLCAGELQPRGDRLPDRAGPHTGGWHYRHADASKVGAGSRSHRDRLAPRHRESEGCHRVAR